MGISALNIMYLLAPATEINGISLGLEKDRELGLCSVKIRFVSTTPLRSADTIWKGTLAVTSRNLLEVRQVSANV